MLTSNLSDWPVSLSLNLSEQGKETTLILLSVFFTGKFLARIYQELFLQASGTLQILSLCKNSINSLTQHVTLIHSDNIIPCFQSPAE